LSFGDYLGPFLLLLGVLVVIHELGHFAVAKWCGVKVERFSVGFGPAVFRRTVGETEYQLSWLPLGGYVKMLGESPEDELSPEDSSRSFNGQSPSRRIAIALAGPGMNLLLPIVVIAGLLMTGWPTQTSLIGSVTPDAPAARAGMLPGDRIVSVDGEEIWRWSELTKAVRGSEGAPLAIEVERGGDRLSLSITPAPFESTVRIGVEQAARSAVIRVSDVEGPAAGAGLRTGDEVIALGARDVGDWYEFERRLVAASGDLELRVARGPGELREEISLVIPASTSVNWSLDALGIMGAETMVMVIEPASPARRAGIEAGDVVLSSGGQDIADWESFAESVATGDGAPLDLLVLRGGHEIEVRLVPVERTLPKDDVAVTSWVTGIYAGAPRRPGEVIDDRVLNPFAALWQGTVRTTELFMVTLDSFGMLLTRKIGVENLAGPIGIGEIAGESFAQEGWFTFLWIMCVISVNLAIINLMPVPILDGGNIVFAIAESVSGGPIGIRAREVAQTVGLSLILLLMGFAFWNDLSRNWGGIVGFFRGLL